MRPAFLHFDTVNLQLPFLTHNRYNNLVNDHSTGCLFLLVSFVWRIPRFIYDTRYYPSVQLRKGLACCVFVAGEDILTGCAYWKKCNVHERLRFLLYCSRKSSGWDGVVNIRCSRFQPLLTRWVGMSSGIQISSPSILSSVIYFRAFWLHNLSGSTGSVGGKHQAMRLTVYELRSVQEGWSARGLGITLAEPSF